jgi:hypothetical protein
MIAEALVPIFFVMVLGYFVDPRQSDIAKADVGVAEGNLAFAAAQVEPSRTTKLWAHSAQ